METIEDFIKNYSESDQGKIEFSPNNKEADDWKDINYSFREQICDKIFKQGVNVSDLLLKDIFRAEAIYSREIWGASQYLGVLGAALLKQTRCKYIEDYLIGKHESFDTECAVSLGDVGYEVIEEILIEMKSDNTEFYEANFTKQEAIEFIQEYYEKK
jgi:hypothetical protein